MLSIAKSPGLTGGLKTKAFAGKEEEVVTNSGSNEGNALKSAKENRKKCSSLGSVIPGPSKS